MSVKTARSFKSDFLTRLLTDMPRLDLDAFLAPSCSKLNQRPFDPYKLFRVNSTKSFFHGTALKRVEVQ